MHEKQNYFQQRHILEKAFPPFLPSFKCTQSVIWVHIGPCKWHSNVYPHSWDHSEFMLLSSGGHPPSQSPLTTAKKNMQEWFRLWLTACCSRASPCPDSCSEIWPSDVRVALQICWQHVPKSHHFVRRSCGSWDVAVVQCAPGRKGSFAASTHRGAPADWGATRAQRPSCPCSSLYRAWDAAGRGWRWMYIPPALMSRLRMASKSYVSAVKVRSWAVVRLHFGFWMFAPFCFFLLQAEAKVL